MYLSENNTFHSSKIWNVFENGIHEYIEENKQTTQQVKKLKVHVLHNRNSCHLNYIANC